MSQVVIICRGDRRTLSCGSSRVLNIATASYGRSSMFSRCNWSTESFCNVRNSLLIVQDECQNKPSCTVEASDSWFGTACSSSGRYLEIKYNCKSGSSPPLEIVVPSVATTAPATPFTEVGAALTPRAALDTNSKMGIYIGIGISVVIAVLLLLTVFWFYKRKQRRQFVKRASVAGNYQLGENIRGVPAKSCSTSPCDNETDHSNLHARKTDNPDVTDQRRLYDFAVDYEESNISRTRVNRNDPSMVEAQ